MKLKVCVFAFFVLSNVAIAETYIYQEGQNVVGNPVLHIIAQEDNFVQLAQKYRVGLDEIIAANPGIDPWIPDQGTQIIIPSQYVLPNVPREGVVINLAELRLYHFHKPKANSTERKVSTFPVSVGKDEQWETPLSQTRIIAKHVKPSWYPPESILKEHEEKNDPLPRVVPPGPDNPLGEYSLRLGLSGYLIHGTNRPNGIGMRVTHGCIRLHPIGIERLFEMVSVNTPVAIVNQPYKVGWDDNKLYVETHDNIEEQQKAASRNLTEFVQSVISQTKDLDEDSYVIEWELGYQEAKSKRGMPFVISRRTSQTSEL